MFLANHLLFRAYKLFDSANTSLMTFICHSLSSADDQKILVHDCFGLKIENSS